MARIRTIKPEFWTDEKILSLDPLTRLLFIGLWNYADDEGYFWNEPFRVKLQVLPMDNCDVVSMLKSLATIGLLTEFVSSDGKSAYCISHFKDHQKVQHPNPSKISRECSPVSVSAHEDSMNAHENSLSAHEISGTFSERSLLKGKGMEGNGREKEEEGSGEGGISPSAQESASDSPPDAVVQEILDSWNRIPGVLKAERVTAKRKASVNARMREAYFRSNWTQGMQRVASSEFCQGVNDRGWKADLEWFLRPDTLLKILEGKYDRANKSREGPSVTLEGSGLANHGQNIKRGNLAEALRKISASGGQEGGQGSGVPVDAGGDSDTG